MSHIIVVKEVNETTPMAVCICGHFATEHDEARCRYCQCEAYRGHPYTPELYWIADAVLDNALKDLRTTGQLNAQVGVRFPGRRVINGVELPEPIAAGMNNGRFKDLFFGLIRDCVATTNADLVVFATEAWVGRATPESQGITREEFERVARTEGADGIYKRGWATRAEALTVTVQTAEAVLVVSQLFERDEAHPRTVGLLERQVMQFGQDQFDGRQKMFGKGKYQ